MHLLAKRLCVFALAVLPLAACAEVTEECPGTAPVAVTVAAWPGPAGVWLEDVELCETGTDNCVMSNANGEATLCLPFDVETSFTRTRIEYASYIAALVIPADGPKLNLDLFMVKETRIAVQLNNLMSPYPMVDTGVIAAGVSPGFAGATFDLLGETEEKLIYRDEELNWTEDLEATTTSGAGGVVEVTPGEHEMVIGGAAEDCFPIRGWPSEEENGVRFPVLEEYLSDVRVDCTFSP